MGVETTDGLYKALVDVFHGISNAARNRKHPELDIRLGNSSYEVIRATLPQVIGTRKSIIRSKISSCEQCALEKSDRSQRKYKEGKEVVSSDPLGVFKVT